MVPPEQNKFKSNVVILKVMVIIAISIVIVTFLLSNYYNNIPISLLLWLPIVIVTLLPKYLILSVKKSPQLSVIAGFLIIDALIVLGYTVSYAGIIGVILSIMWVPISLFVAIMFRAANHTWASCIFAPVYIQLTLRLFVANTK